MVKPTDMGIYDILTSKGFTPEVPFCVRKTLAISEKGVHYRLCVSDGKPSCCFAVDGYIVKEGNKCDKLVLVEQEAQHWAEIFVELKGSGIEHAIDQLRATLQKKIFCHPANKTLKARIVGHSFPANKANSAMEKAKREFKAKFHCELRGLKNGQFDKI